MKHDPVTALRETIKIIGTETLGVRGLCTVFKAGKREILIDPGLALGYNRGGLLPHPVQVGVGAVIRNDILSCIDTATDIVFSHYHGDHIPLSAPNPFQLSLGKVISKDPDCRFWAKPFSGDNVKRSLRAEALFKALEGRINTADEPPDDVLSFHGPFSHGPEGSRLGEVLITAVETPGGTLCHASDIQLMSDRAVEFIVELSPVFLIASGPPLYLDSILPDDLERARQNALLLAEHVDVMVIDHHLFRSMEGYSWINEVRKNSGNTILTAAEFEGIPEHPLEAQRKMLYRDLPVPSDWHSNFAAGEKDFEGYLESARVIYPWFKY